MWAKTTSKIAMVSGFKAKQHIGKICQYPGFWTSLRVPGARNLGSNRNEFKTTLSQNCAFMNKDFRQLSAPFLRENLICLG